MCQGKGVIRPSQEAGMLAFLPQGNDLAWGCTLEFHVCLMSWRWTLMATAPSVLELADQLLHQSSAGFLLMVRVPSWFLRLSSREWGRNTQGAHMKENLFGISIFRLYSLSVKTFFFFSERVKLMQCQAFHLDSQFSFAPFPATVNRIWMFLKHFSYIFGMFSLCRKLVAWLH